MTAVVHRSHLWSLVLLTSKLFDYFEYNWLLSIFLVLPENMLIVNDTCVLHHGNYFIAFLIIKIIYFHCKNSSKIKYKNLKSLLLTKEIKPIVIFFLELWFYPFFLSPSLSPAAPTCTHPPLVLIINRECHQTSCWGACPCPAHTLSSMLRIPFCIP